MNTQEFADLADELYLKSEDAKEALNRTIIGRWYYAAYHDIKNWLEAQFPSEFEAAKGRSHEKLTFCCNTLQRKNMDLSFSKLGRLTSELKNHRVSANYKLNTKCKNLM